MVKLYVPEPGSEILTDLGELVVSELAQIEVASAIWRKVRLAELDPEQGELLIGDFEQDFFATGTDSRYAPVAINSRITALASRLVRVHDLKTLDAIQMATAMAARKVDPDIQVFVCFDRQLTEAASAEGFTVIPSS